MKKQCCIICRKPLNDGIIINGRGICKNCESRIINSYRGTDFYDYYKECIKKSVVNPMLKNEECISCQDYH